MQISIVLLLTVLIFFYRSSLAFGAFPSDSTKEKKEAWGGYKTFMTLKNKRDSIHSGFPEDLKSEGLLFVLPDDYSKKIRSRSHQKTMCKRIAKELSRSLPLPVRVVKEEDLKQAPVEFSEGYQLRIRITFRSTTSYQTMNLGYGVTQIFGTKSKSHSVYSLVLDDLRDPEQRYFISLGDSPSGQLGNRLVKKLKNL